MKDKIIIGSLLAMLAALLFMAAAPDPGQLNVPGVHFTGANAGTNLTDTGSGLTYGGVPVGGGSAPSGTVVNTTSGSAGAPLVLSAAGATNTAPATNFVIQPSGAFSAGATNQLQFGGTNSSGQVGVTVDAMALHLMTQEGINNNGLSVGGAGTSVFTNGITMLNATGSRPAIFDSAKNLTNGTASGTQAVNANGAQAAAAGLSDGTTGSGNVVLGTGPSISAPVLSGSGTESGNIGALMAAGNTSYIDLTIASRTNDVSGAFTLAHATNGAAGTHLTQVRWFSNSSGSDQTLAIPVGWRTNLYSAVPTKITNGWITKMIVESWGDTSNSTLQTNVFVSFEYFH